MQIVRKKLSATEVTPATIRYNPDCDCVEQTWDDGATWTPTPGSDPRSSPAFRAPALTGGTAQCDAAAGMVAGLRQLITADLAANTQAALASLLLGVALLFIPVAGWIADAFLLVADAIILLDQATIEAAFTEMVYDQLLCTFRDNIDADGQMSDEQLTAFLEDVFTNYDFTVYSVISSHSDGLGAVGWSNMGSIAGETGDCGDCVPTWCISCDFTLSDGGFSSFFGEDYGVYVPGTGWVATDTSIGADRTIIEAQAPLGATFHVTSALMIYDSVYSECSGAGSSGTGIGYGSGGNGFEFTNTSGSQDVQTGTDLVWEFISEQDVDTISMENQVAFQCHAGSSTIKYYELHGTGDPPILTGWTAC